MRCQYLNLRAAIPHIGNGLLNTSVAIEPVIKRGIKELAERERRSANSTLNLLLREALEARSVLPSSAPQCQQTEAAA